MLKNMVDKTIGSGANVVLCQKGIDDMAQHYLAKAGILAVRRIKESDLTKLAKATGARIVTNLDDLFEKDLGSAELVEERKIEEDKWVFVEGCKHPKSVTLLIRGGSQRVVDEVERSAHDAIMVVKDVMETPLIVAGGGSPETFTATKIRSWAKSLEGREQLAAEKFADSLESIPLALAETAGMDYHDLGPGRRITAREQEEAYPLARCMTCGCCVEACPQFNERSPFIGPAAISQAILFNDHPTGRVDRDERLAVLASVGGIADCGNSQNCVKVCPKDIPLTGSIAKAGRDTTLYKLRQWFGR